MKHFTGNKFTPADLSVDVVYSLPTKRIRRTRYFSTDTDTGDSAGQVANALASRGAAVRLVPLSENGYRKQIRNTSGNLIFNLLEWTGQDLYLSADCMKEIEKTQIPFTGASRTNFLLAADKAALKAFFQKERIPTPQWQVFTKDSLPIIRKTGYPVIVKPAKEHCSIGLDRTVIANNLQELRKIIKRQIAKHRQPVIAEQYIPGREFQVTVLSRHRKPWVLPAAEILFGSPGPDFLTYESRWDSDHPDYKNSRVRIAVLEQNLKEKLNRIGRMTFCRLGFSDYTRLDVRTDGNRIYVLEANSNPGLGDDEEYGMTLSCQAAGLTFTDLVYQIVSSCLDRYGYSLV
jgi:D-alanine-D-alanine ligase